MKQRKYNVIITEIDPSIPRVMRLLKTSSLDHAINVADKMKSKLRLKLACFHQTIVVVTYDGCGYVDSVDYVPN